MGSTWCHTMSRAQMNWLTLASPRNLLHQLDSQHQHLSCWGLDHSSCSQSTGPNGCFSDDIIIHSSGLWDKRVSPWVIHHTWAVTVISFSNRALHHLLIACCTLEHSPAPGAVEATGAFFGHVIYNPRSKGVPTIQLVSLELQVQGSFVGQICSLRQS